MGTRSGRRSTGWATTHIAGTGARGRPSKQKPQSPPSVVQHPLPVANQQPHVRRARTSSQLAVSNVVGLRQAATPEPQLQSTADRGGARHLENGGIRPRSFQTGTTSVLQPATCDAMTRGANITRRTTRAPGSLRVRLLPAPPADSVQHPGLLDSVGGNTASPPRTWGPKTQWDFSTTAANPQGIVLHDAHTHSCLPAEQDALKRK